MANNTLTITVCYDWEDVLSLTARGEATQQGGIGYFDMPDALGCGGVITTPTEIAGFLQKMVEDSEPVADGDELVLNCNGYYLFITPAIKE